jgi:hypothetical protein
MKLNVNFSEQVLDQTVNSRRLFTPCHNSPTQVRAASFLRILSHTH